MTRRRTPVLLAAAAICAGACGLAATALAGEAGGDGIRTAGIAASGDLVLRLPGGPPRTIAHGGAGRDKPVFSPDGSRIAFLQKTDRRVALDTLVVVGLDGHEFARVLIEPAAGGLDHSGMRAVEEIRWLAPGRVMVRGGINPSQSQYYVVDPATRRVVADLVDDGSGAAWSPDGTHVATTSGEPHFEAEEDHRPVVEVDGRAVYPAKATRDIALRAAPRWSADGRSLGWVVLHRPDATLVAVVRRGDTVHETRLGTGSSDDAVATFWSGSRLIVAQAPVDDADHPTHAWAVDAGTARAIAPAEAVDPLRDARRLRARLVGEAIAAGLAAPDAWCARCALQALPRASE